MVLELTNEQLCVLFNKNNKNEEEIVNVLTEIKDNLKYGVNEDRFDTVIRNLENTDYSHEFEKYTEQWNALLEG